MHETFAHAFSAGIKCRHCMCTRSMLNANGLTDYDFLTPADILPYRKPELKSTPDDTRIQSNLLSIPW